MAALVSSTAAEPTKTNAGPRVAVVAVGAGTEKLAEHARNWALANIPVQIDLLPPQKKVGDSLDAIAADAVKLAGKGHPVVVAVAMPPASVTSHGMRTADGRSAVVNVRAMQADQPDAQKLERRIERQVIRAIALMIDMPSCVNGQCALSQYQSLEDLDRAGRNLCPPCSQNFQNAADAAKLELNPENPFYTQK